MENVNIIFTKIHPIYMYDSHLNKLFVHQTFLTKNVIKLHSNDVNKDKITDNYKS